MNGVLLSTVLSLLFASSSALFINIDANEEQCFFDRLTSGTKFGLMFEVAEGGFLDIDVQITGPDNKNVYKGERESFSRFTFAAHMDGIYTYCFGNKMSTMAPKSLMFTVDITEPHVQAPGAAPNQDSADNQKLEEMVRELSSALMSVKHEQEYMEVRERVHRSINENTNSRVVMWAVFEAIVLVGMTVGQIFYLKRFFEVRTMEIGREISRSFVDIIDEIETVESIRALPDYNNSLQEFAFPPAEEQQLVEAEQQQLAEMRRQNDARQHAARENARQNEPVMPPGRYQLLNDRFTRFIHQLLRQTFPNIYVSPVVLGRLHVSFEEYLLENARELRRGLYRNIELAME